jgi:hypothetical protein
MHTFFIYMCVYKIVFTKENPLYELFYSLCKPSGIKYYVDFITTAK